MKYSIHDITIIGTLSSLCGVFEIGLGTLLHAVNMPFTGSIMVLLNLIVYFVARRLVPRAGTILIIGFTTALLKLLYSGGNKLSPAVAIFIEALMIEIILDLVPLNRFSAILTGCLVQPFTLFYPFISYMFIGGSPGMIEKLIRDRGALLNNMNAPQVFLLFLLFYIFMGAMEGFIAWTLCARGIDFYRAHVKRNRVAMSERE
jgi:hypothetical protein